MKNKWWKVYNQLIEKRLTCIPEGYCEKHHIIPKFMGGDNSKENLVYLTAREHYIAHKLLMKICEKHSSRKIYGKSVFSVLAFMMNYFHEDRYILNSRQIEEIRKKVTIVKKESPVITGWKQSEEAKMKMKQNHWSKRGVKHGMLGKNHNDFSISKMRKHSTKNWYDAYSPDGTIYENISIPELVRKFDLNVDALNRFKGKVVPPIPDRVKSQTNQSRLNTTGWKIIPISNQED
jgi:hypothetical protein